MRGGWWNNLLDEPTCVTTLATLGSLKIDSNGQLIANSSIEITDSLTFDDLETGVYYYFVTDGVWFSTEYTSYAIYGLYITEDSYYIDTFEIAAKSKDSTLAGTYKTTGNLYMRNGAGTSKKALVVLPKGTSVKNYGYYTVLNGVKWLYVQVTYKNVKYTGFCCGTYLSKQ